MNPSNPLDLVIIWAMSFLLPTLVGVAVTQHRRKRTR